jgi:hypothetical protein
MMLNQRLEFTFEELEPSEVGHSKREFGEGIK